MTVAVIAHPNSKRPRVEKDPEGALHVYVSAPPLEGKANAAIIEALAEYFQTKKSNVVLMAGEKGKKKRVMIYTAD